MHRFAMINLKGQKYTILWNLTGKPLNYKMDNAIMQLTLYLLVLSADNFCKTVLLKDFFKKLIEKNQQMTKKHEKLSSMQRVIIHVVITGRNHHIEALKTYVYSDFIWPFLRPYMGVISNPKMAFIFPISCINYFSTYFPILN